VLRFAGDKQTEGRLGIERMELEIGELKALAFRLRTVNIESEPMEAGIVLERLLNCKDRKLRLVRRPIEFVSVPVRELNSKLS
jgi:hypothetical protein